MRFHNCKSVIDRYKTIKDALEKEVNEGKARTLEKSNHLQRTIAWTLHFSPKLKTLPIHQLSDAVKELLRQASWIMNGGKRMFTTELLTVS